MEYVVNMLMDSDTIQAELLPDQMSVGLTLEEMEREYLARGYNFNHPVPQSG